MNSGNTTISGRAMTATVKALKELGTVGERILKKHGATGVELEKQYPYEIRVNILQEVLDRFGEDAFFVIGYEQQGLWKDMDDALNNFFIANKSRLSYFEDMEIAETAIEEFLRIFAETSQGGEGGEGKIGLIIRLIFLNKPNY